jgi:hypothetical protein
MIGTENLSKHIKRSSFTTMLLAGLLASSMVVTSASSQSAAPPPAGPPAPRVVARPAAAGAPTRYLPSRFSRRAEEYYGVVWGVGSLSVKAVESGELVRFSYRVLDADKARVINDKKIDAFLVAPDAEIRLSVPSLEKVGQLRQSSSPEAGKSYWMAFSNPGRRVKRGDRVNVVIGTFNADGLVVE